MSKTLFLVKQIACRCSDEVQHFPIRPVIFPLKNEFLSVLTENFSHDLKHIFAKWLKVYPLFKKIPNCLYHTYTTVKNSDESIFIRLYSSHIKNWGSDHPSQVHHGELLLITPAIWLLLSNCFGGKDTHALLYQGWNLWSLCTQKEGKKRFL